MQNVKFDLRLEWQKTGERNGTDVWACIGDVGRGGDGAWRLLVQKEGSPPETGEVLDCVLLEFRPRSNQAMADLTLPKYNKLKHLLVVVGGPRTDGVDNVLSELENLTWHTDKAPGQGHPTKYPGKTSKKSILAPDSIWNALQSLADEEGVSRNEMAVRLWTDGLDMEDDFSF